MNRILIILSILLCVTSVVTNTEWLGISSAIAGVLGCIVFLYRIMTMPLNIQEFMEKEDSAEEDVGWSEIHDDFREQLKN